LRSAQAFACWWFLLDFGVPIAAMPFWAGLGTLLARRLAGQARSQPSVSWATRERVRGGHCERGS
jgi:hypothetical protein